LRALCEGQAPTLDLLAAAARRTPHALALKARREGWRMNEAVLHGVEASGEAARARLTALAVSLVGDMEDLVREAAEGGPLDKSRVEAVSLLIRTLEKLGEITRGEGGAKENQTRNDAELAKLLQRIDERIVELAHAYAEGLGA